MLLHEEKSSTKKKKKKKKKSRSAVNIGLKHGKGGGIEKRQARDLYPCKKGSY